MKAKVRPTHSLLLICLLALATLSPSVVFQQATQTLPITFEIELPEMKIGPTTRAEVPIPSTRISQILIHISGTQADNIDYSRIFTFINGEAAATIADVVPGERGKLVRLQLDRRADFRLIAGRNAVEVRAENRRGRIFYASFILKTATENRNQDFIYSVTLAGDFKEQVPPELMLLEPEGPIEIPASQESQVVRISGVATARGSIERVTINGQAVAIKRGEQTRKIGLANEDNRVTFDATYTATAAASEIVVEAVDSAGNRTQLKVPVAQNKEAIASEFRGKKYALIVGVSRFADTALNLKYADADAISIQKFLLSPGGGRFSSENILTLLNEQATLAEIKKALTAFVAQPGPDDLLLIFYASHGGPDPLAEQNYYFLAHDSRVDRLPETGLPMKDFQMMLQQNVRARRMVLLVDTCHSAGLAGTEGEMTRSLRNNLVNLYAERLLYREEGRAVLTSSDVSEKSREATKWGGGHGVFTHFVLEGLQGKADVNADHLVTVSELFRFVRQKVRLETQFSQNPRLLVNTNENLALAAVSPARR